MVNSAINQDELSPVESPAVVVMDIALRDRDFARLQTAQDGSGLESLGSCKNCLFWGGLFPTHRLSRQVWMMGCGGDMMTSWKA